LPELVELTAGIGTIAVVTISELVELIRGIAAIAVLKRAIEVKLRRNNAIMHSLHQLPTICISLPFSRLIAMRMKYCLEFSEENVSLYIGSRLSFYPLPFFPSWSNLLAY
jgi:hypothetical protein